ncbi:MAG: LamG-like jellyroll fold domain-containing protein, partial [Candidatus Brocadiia bacterium]
MAYRIVSSLDNPNAILGPLLGAPGIALGAVSFMPAVFGPGIRCDQGYVRFPTRAGGVELVSNSAGSISIWLKSLYPSGNPAGKQVVFSLYNDAGSNIIVFFDSDNDRFGFSEGEVGEVKEASARSFPFNAFFSLSLTWNGNWRRLYVNQALACEQRQGAEFIPTCLALGGVEFGGRQLASWPSYSGVIDNLKAEDIYRTSFADLNQQGVPTADSRPAFARTLLVSPRPVYLSAPADNQRNSLITGKGVAASRDCYMLTGSRDYRSAYAEVSLSSTRASYASAPMASVRFASLFAVSPLSAERSSSICAAAGALAQRFCALFASSDAIATRSAAYTAYAPISQERAAALHALGCASVARESTLTAKAVALRSRFASLSALPGTADTRDCRTTGTEGILEKRTVSSVGSAMAAAAQSLKTRPSFFRGLAAGDSSIAGLASGSLRALSPASATIRGASPLLSRRDI